MFLRRTDGGDSKAPSGEARNLYLNYGDAAKERDELRTRLAHAEADAEQAIHNEAFNERMKIVAWIRARIAYLSLDSRTTMQALDALLSMAVEIEQGERGPGIKPEPNLRADNAKLREENARLRAALRGLFKPDGIPYAQWTREMHAAHIALESER